MNLILFELDEISRPLKRDDPRAVHIVETLRLKAGESFDAGVVNGSRGKALIDEVGDSAIAFTFSTVLEPAPGDPIEIIVGLPRPQSARRILHDASALGVRKITFAATARSDPNYAKSTLWKSDEWRRHLIDGAQQAFDTRIPEVIQRIGLREAIAGSARSARIAFDNYECETSLPAFLRSGAGTELQSGAAAVLAFGPERGWHAEDRTALRNSGFALVSLGRRVMRVETAIVSAIAILRAQLGWDQGTSPGPRVDASNC